MTYDPQILDYFCTDFSHQIADEALIKHTTRQHNVHIVIQFLNQPIHFFQSSFYLDWVILQTAPL